ncbi:MAG: ribonuclease P protein component [Actinomycetales bacterium]|nr:ribonuclease P protein component [Actinomycetales bacterium]
MLARANRVIRADDFRRAVRRGRRSATPRAVYYRYPTADDEPLRFGFIVSRTVGGSVQRNRVRRRMRAIGREFVEAGVRGHDVVIRALPGVDAVAFGELRDDAHQALDRGLGVTRS